MSAANRELVSLMPPRSRPVMFKRVVRWVVVLVLVVALCVVGCGVFAYSQLRASLPTLDGEFEVVGVQEPVRVDRDDHGIPTIHAKSRIDLGYALGFSHGQDRFFQMDVLRRSAAGELAELFGPGLVSIDKGHRLFRFRDYAKQFHDTVPPDERALVEAYTAGVNAGLNSLGQKPFEYLVLGVEPQPWRTEDVALVAMAMFIDLQGGDYRDEAARMALHDTLPQPLYDFLNSVGNEWDAPIDGTKFEQPPIPGPEVYDLREKLTANAASFSLASLPLRSEMEPFHAGSNNWAIAGTHSKHGGALIANDMHLRIGVPNIWYRAQFRWPASDGGEQTITGATLPGTPVMVVGSNGHVAWGFTNSEGDWTDVVVIEVDPDHPNQYSTPGEKFSKHPETIRSGG
ncbi:MAG: penicillin acylase family protein [Planctomycetota bacterium]